VREIAKGATSQTLYVVALDSASTTGGRKTGIAYNAAGLTAYYVRNRAASVAITLATLASSSAAWSSGGWVEVDATNAPGLYRLDVPDAAFATGVDSVVVVVRGAAGMVQTEEEVLLVAYNPQDATALGLSRLDTAVSSRLASGNVTVGGYAAGQDPATLTLVTPANKLATDASGRVTVGSIVNAAIAAATFAANALGAAWDELRASHIVANSFGAGTIVATNNDKTGYSLTTLPPTVAQIWGEPVPAAYAAGSAGNKLGNVSGAAGAGANTVTVTVQNDATHPVAGASFWVTTDVGGTNVVASGTTDTFGHVTVYLANGTFYGWASKPGENFTNPLSMTVP
jgi:hypothetical protein